MQIKGKPTEQYNVGSVLLSDHIESLVNRKLLIVDDPFYGLGNTFDEKQLDRAKYNVRLGKAYLKAGKYGILDEKNNPLLAVEPYELVFVESYEVFELPDNIVARYDLRIGGCLRGMGLQTGLQLDPTYYGRFFCPLFNFSSEIFTLKYKDHLASVEFIYTTPPTSRTKHYGGKNKLFSLGEALPSTSVRSGLEKLWTDMKGTQETLESELVSFRKASTRLDTRVDTMVGAVFQAMAFLIAALGVIAAAMAIVVTSKFIVWPFPLLISLIILFVIAFGALAFIRKTVGKK